MKHKNDREDQPVRSERSEHTRRQYEIPRGRMANQKQKKTKKVLIRGMSAFQFKILLFLFHKPSLSPPNYQ